MSTTTHPMHALAHDAAIAARTAPDWFESFERLGLDSDPAAALALAARAPTPFLAGFLAGIASGQIGRPR